MPESCDVGFAEIQIIFYRFDSCRKELNVNIKDTKLKAKNFDLNVTVHLLSLPSVTAFIAEMQEEELFYGMTIR